MILYCDGARLGAALVLESNDLTLNDGVSITYPDNNTSYIQADGTGTVVQAVGDGRRAAMATHKMIRKST